MQDKYVLNCPFCGGTEVIESWQGGYGAVTAVSNKWGGVGLYHSICRALIHKRTSSSIAITFTFRQSGIIENPYIPAPVTRLCSL